MLRFLCSTRLTPLGVRHAFGKAPQKRLTKGNKSNEKPIYRAPDPVQSMPGKRLPENLTFIHRPPPSAPSPFSLTTAPSSPLLWARATPYTPETPQPPHLRPSAIQEPRARTSDEDILEMRRLRASNPKKYTQTALAKQFNCTPYFVSSIAGLKRSVRKPLVAKVERMHEQQRNNWGDRTAMVRAIRAKRRSLW